MLRAYGFVRVSRQKRRGVHALCTPLLVPGGERRSPVPATLVPTERVGHRLGVRVRVAALLASGRVLEGQRVAGLPYLQEVHTWAPELSWTLAVTQRVGE